MPISLWSHSAGNEGEMKVISRMITEFNASQKRLRGGSADTRRTPTTRPCRVRRRPMTCRAFWMSTDRSCRVGVERLVGAARPGRRRMSRTHPSTVGRYDGQIYTVGYWDATTALFSRRSVLERSTASVFPAWIAADGTGVRRGGAAHQGVWRLRVGGRLEPQRPERVVHLCVLATCCASGAISSTGRTTRRPTAS